MKRIFIKYLVFMIPMLFGALSVMSQGVVKGVIVDSETGETLIGATVMIQGTSIGDATDLDGKFLIKTDKTGRQTLVFRSVGYLEMTKVVELNNTELDLGVIKMSPSTIGLEEVRITASIVSKDRHTPVTISNIEPEMIETKMSNQEFPEIMKSTPSVYATKDGGGYGDSRINVRGFSTSNMGVLINGVPVNGMENGAVYWSNWSGLSDVTQYIQIQRGMGASKLGISSVGGTMNIITKGTDAQLGGGVYYGIGNDGYEKMSVNVSTGLIGNGWAVTLAGSRSKGDGYVKGTDYEGWSYFVNVSKRINDAHRLSFTAFGAPQWHNQRGNKHSIQTYREHKDGTRMNSSYGYINGKIVGTGYGYNEYHKPQLSLNHYWKISDRSRLSTVAYASFSSGGGRRLRGTKANWLQWDYTLGKPTEETMLTPDGLIDYERAMKENAASPDGSKVVFTMSTNSHDWYGLLSSFNTDLSEALKVTGGLDVRYYKGYHFEEIEDLLGGKYYIDNNIAYREKNVPLHKGDKVNFYNTGEILWGGLFGQAEYVKDAYSAFISASVTEEAYRRDDPGKYGVYGNTSKYPVDQKTSDWIRFTPWSVKGGLNYKFATYHNVYVNGGYFTRAPYMNFVFLDNTNQVNEDAKYEKIYTFEGGYGINSGKLALNVNYYYTKWMDKGLKMSLGNNESATVPGIDAVHQGVELEGSYKPLHNLFIKGAFSWGDWVWADNVSFKKYDGNQNLLGEFNSYVKDVHVGNSAQVMAALGIGWDPFTNLHIGLDANYFGKNYADFDPENRTKPEDAVDAWKLPDYFTMDARFRYRFNISGVKATIFGNVNNLFNEKYIADAKDGSAHDMYSALVYYGFGRTWTFGMKINF